MTVTLPVATGATVAGTVITPAAKTGPIRVRAQDTATGTFNEVPKRIDSMPTKVTGSGRPVPPGRRRLRLTESRSAFGADRQHGAQRPG